MEEVVFEEGGQVRRLKGKIIKEDSDFVTVETHERIFRINKAKIIKIEQTTDEG